MCCPRGYSGEIVSSIYELRKIIITQKIRAPKQSLLHRYRSEYCGIISKTKSRDYSTGDYSITFIEPGGIIFWYNFRTEQLKMMD